MTSVSATRTSNVLPNTSSSRDDQSSVYGAASSALCSAGWPCRSGTTLTVLTPSVISAGSPSDPTSSATVYSTCCWEVPSGTSMSVTTQVLWTLPSSSSSGSNALPTLSISPRVTEVRPSPL